MRPDYGVSVGKVMRGYIEVKAPGRKIDPDQMTGHDLEQWERQRDLPNLIYTNGTRWRLYRDGEFIDEALLTELELTEIGAGLRSNPKFEGILRAFLAWKPDPIVSVNALVRAIAPLTRLLRGEVLDQLVGERKAVSAGAKEEDQPFIGLARDWRRLLFPQADDKKFADGYAQAVTFALLLARTSGIEFEGRSLHDVGKDLGVQHSLMGRALQLLIDDVAADFKVALDLLVTVIGSVRWERIRKTRRDVYLYLYESFLQEYDDELRQASGTYYTPRELVTEMVRLTQDVLVQNVGIEEGFSSPGVFTIDPAMGTGTFLHSVVETVRKHVEDEQGPGAVPGAMTELAGRLAGFEIQMGPYAVAELRVAELFADAGATLPKDGLKLYVTDTLDDPTADETQIASGLHTIANSRKRANAIKRNQKVNVIIGNPPYRELAAGQGGWVEQGTPSQHGPSTAILGDFLDGVPGRLAAKVKNLYVYFWRWATWKVWESTPADESGVVCFVTTSGYVTGTAFTGMRRHIRQHASEGWIIDLTPEGHTPDVATRMFPGVRQPLAIGIFVRRPGTSREVPADLHYISVRGRRADKFTELQGLTLDAAEWRPVRKGWTDPFTAAATSAWDEWPAVDQLMPWYSPGVFPTRTWVYSPSASCLEERWTQLVGEPELERRRVLMKDTTGAINVQFKDIPGHPHAARLNSIASLPVDNAMEKVVTIGFRAFDRQKLIADPRLIHRARDGLWAAAAVPNQVYVVEQHSVSISDGPALLFSAHMPDFHHFNNRGGRTLPFLNPDGTPNFAPGLSTALTGKLNARVEAEDILAYLAAVTAHPAFTQTFAVELETPGIRIPITADEVIWTKAVSIGRQVLWAQTFAQAFVDHPNGRPAHKLAYERGDSRRVSCLAPVSELPDGMVYDEEEQEIVLGNGRFGPVPRAVVEYEVGGRNVLRSWVAYRTKEPAGKRTSPLDDVNPGSWCCPSRYLTVAASSSVTMSGSGKAPPDDSGGAF
ncbi:type ISP restriction/modification enzyme, partial [Cryobacterium melibiosiphilum]